MAAPFVKVPVGVAIDARLTLGARAAYPVFRHLAWQAGMREEGEEVDLPPLDEIAKICGCAPSTLKSYLGELRRAGWISTERVSLRRPLRYVFLAASSSDLGLLGAAPDAAPAPPSSPDSVPPRAGSSGSKKELDQVQDQDLPPRTPPSRDTPPKIPRSEGQNRPLNALVEVCSMDADSPRIELAVAALEGRARGKPGIRTLYWQEAWDYAEAHDQLDRLAAFAADPQLFAEALENRIRHKASLWRRRFPPGTILTPTALRSWWLDLERMPDIAASRGLTPEQIVALGARS